jgi:N-acetylglutamate synthase-like GNAT family acetyltransferase
VFITRASRHDRPDVEEFLARQGWPTSDVSKGALFFAREGGVVGCVHLLEVEPASVVVKDLVVDSARRRRGIGRSLLQAAMNSRGGTLYVRCDADAEGFFERFDFAPVDEDDVPGAVRAADGLGERYLKAR